jgi:hypothetical protein
MFQHNLHLRLLHKEFNLTRLRKRLQLPFLTQGLILQCNPHLHLL